MSACGRIGVSVRPQRTLGLSHRNRYLDFSSTKGTEIPNIGLVWIRMVGWHVAQQRSIRVPRVFCFRHRGRVRLYGANKLDERAFVQIGRLMR